MPPPLRPALLGILALLGFGASASAADLISIQPLGDRVLSLHFKEGNVEYHQAGQSRHEDVVFIEPLDLPRAIAVDSYKITSSDDHSFGVPILPERIGRKSKGTEFAWYVDNWEKGRAVNKRPDQVREHWIYLELPLSLKTNRTYEIDTSFLAKNGRKWTLRFDAQETRSEAVHVNTLGYVPAAPEKFGYLYAWMGDLGPLDLGAHDGREFRLVDTATKRTAYTGKISFRMPKTQPETSQKNDTPNQNFLGADVWQCDFSDFNRPGEYRLVVDGLGCSWPFKIGDDVYRQPFYHVVRSLYHNRSGIELKAPHTTFTRPAPHHPKLTPGFEKRLFYTSVRHTEWGSEGGDRAKLDAGKKGNLTETWGWYQDAGDWDAYIQHLRVPIDLLFAYEAAPAIHLDGGLNIPESGNAVPDILDEAAWLPRFAHRLRHELLAKGYGTGGIGLRVAGDAYGSDEKVLPDGKKVGQGSWQDVDRDWVVSGEDPWSTYGYAGVAAHLAHALKLAGVADPEGVDWRKEAVEAYAWAKANTRPGDEKVGGVSLRDLRLYAAAALFRLTGEAAYDEQFVKDADDIMPGTLLAQDARYGPWIYALGGGAAPANPGTLKFVTAAVLHTADEIVVNSASKRALRWGGNFDFPMLVGHQTTPWVMEGVIGYLIARKNDPAKARAYLAGLYTTADYFLGTNSQNMTWITGVGPRHPTHIFHMDAWYNGGKGYQPGLIPYGHWRKDTEGVGPWDRGWPHHTVYPKIDVWPGNERYFANRCSPMSAEFTVHQQSGPAAALFAFLASAPAAP